MTSEVTIIDVDHNAVYAELYEVIITYYTTTENGMRATFCLEWPQSTKVIDGGHYVYGGQYVAGGFI